MCATAIALATFLLLAGTGDQHVPRPPRSRQLHTDLQFSRPEAAKDLFRGWSIRTRLRGL